MLHNAPSFHVSPLPVFLADSIDDKISIIALRTLILYAALICTKHLLIFPLSSAKNMTGVSSTLKDELVLKYANVPYVPRGS